MRRIFWGGTVIRRSIAHSHFNGNNNNAAGSLPPHWRSAERAAIQDSIIIITCERFSTSKWSLQTKKKKNTEQPSSFARIETSSIPNACDDDRQDLLQLPSSGSTSTSTSTSTNPWLSHAPKGFWQDVSNQQRFLRWLEQQLGVTKPEDWYNVNWEEVTKLGGNKLLRLYDSSLFRVLSRFYPNVDWLPWRFPGSPRRFWADHANHRRFFDWAATQLNINRLEDWHTVTAQDIYKIGGSGLLKNYYRSSLFKALVSVYPEHKWLPWKFDIGVPAGYWDDISNQRLFFEYAVQQLGISNLDDWYRVRYEDIQKLGGKGLLSIHYGNSLQKALTVIYPHHPWLPWRFTTGVSQHFWSDHANRRKFMDWAAAQLGFCKHEDWYNGTSDDVIKLGGGTLLKLHECSLFKLLSAIYPEVEWLPWKFSAGVPAGYWSDINNQRQFFDWAAPLCNVHKPEDWFSVERSTIYELGGGGLLNSCYGGSIVRALSAVYPDSNLDRAWLYKGGVPNDFWTDQANHRKFFDWAATQLGFTSLEGWYTASSDDIRKLGGGGLLAVYSGSLYNALAATYPQYDWLPWMFSGGVPHRYWRDMDNQKKYWNWVSKRLNITRPEDWYQISGPKFREAGGSGMLQAYQGSIYHALQALCPEYNWIPWKFANGVPPKFWHSHSNRRWFFDWAAKELGIHKPEDWYSVSREAIAELGGAGLLNQFEGGAVAKALADAYPEHNFLPWLCQGGSYGFWKDPTSHRTFFDWAAAQLSVNKPEDWYSICRDDVYKLGGSGLIEHYYEGSLIRALAEVYPEYDWQPWRFRRFTVNEKNFDIHSGADLKRYVDFLTKELNIQDLDDWYRVSMDQIREVGGSNIINYYGGLLAVLSYLFPEHSWDERKFHQQRGKKSTQRWLGVLARKMFPNEEILEEFSHRRESSTEEPVTLDVWIPSLSLAFEYHGEQHYHHIHYFGDPSKQREIDKTKTLACENIGVTLVTVPYWWDRTMESIAATIADLRPDLVDKLGSDSLFVQAAAKGTAIAPEPPTKLNVNFN